MKCFLTSSPMIPGTNTLNPENGFADKLRASLPSPCKALFICSDPDGYDRTDMFAMQLRAGFEEAGFSFRHYDILDGRNREQAEELVEKAEFLILAGGHVPTQNRFFNEIGLKGILHSYNGVLMGISAGTMNSAEVVYAHPELDGEAVDPDFRKYLPGLGLTDKMILPHYQLIKDDVLDGLRVMEDIAYPDSMGRCFYILPDGSWLYSEDSREQLFGEAWLLSEGKLSPICAKGASVNF